MCLQTPMRLVNIMCCENIPKEEYWKYLARLDIYVCQKCGIVWDHLFHAVCWNCQEIEEAEKNKKQELIEFGTVNAKGSMVVRYAFPTKEGMKLYDKMMDNFIKDLTEVCYDHFDFEFKVMKTKTQDGKIIIEFKHPDLLAKEVNLI